MKKPSLLPPGGHLTKILSSETCLFPEVMLDDLSFDEAPNAGGPSTGKPHQPMPALQGYQGVYYVLHGVFVGDVVSSTPGAARTHYSLLEGPRHMPQDEAEFDADCVAAARERLGDPAFRGKLLLPIGYSQLVRSSGRLAYEKLLSTLPADKKSQVGATVYGAPRCPSFQALSTINASLRRYLSSVNLQVTDPAFEVEQLGVQAVDSVTLVLPDERERVRLSALNHFAGRRNHYKLKKIWAGVTNVRTRQELNACATLGVPFATGAGVCRLQSEPVSGRMCNLDALPVLAA